MTNPRLTAIIPVFNVEERKLSAMCASIGNQAVEGCEVLLVDDGSSAGCATLLDRLVAQYEGFKVIHKAHEGVSAARNCGLDNMKGKYCTFIDADDEIREGCFATVLDYMDQNNLDAAITDVTFVWENGKTLHRAVAQPSYFRLISPVEKLGLIRTLVVSYTAPREFVYLTGVFPGGAAKFYRSDICRQYRFNTTMPRSEDGAYCINVLEQCQRIGIIDDSWYMYNQYSGSVTKNDPVGAMSKLGKETADFANEIADYPGRDVDLQLRNLNILLNYLPQAVARNSRTDAIRIIKKVLNEGVATTCRDVDLENYNISKYRKTAMSFIKTNKSTALYLLLVAHNVAKGSE